MNEENKKQIQFNSPNMWLALGLIVIGLIFLLDNLGIVHGSFIWRLWPLIFIFMGLTKQRSPNPSEKGSAWIFFALGVGFLLVNFNIIRWHTIWQFWPLILILIGLSILLKHRDKPQSDTSGSYCSSSESAHHRIDTVAVFGGTERIVTSDNFQGGRVSAVFGGAEVDLSRASLAHGENVIEVFTLFGGTELYIPGDWNVIIQGVPIFGGFEDARKNVKIGNLPEDRKLIVKGFVLFGGLEIKDAKV